MPLVSVIIPVYNTEPFLKTCLDSVQSQTLRDFEVVAVNDGSTDGSARILSEYTERNPAVFRVITQANAGAAAARNAGIAAASGEYIAFLDSDDWVAQDFLEFMVQEARRTGADIVDCEVFLAEEHPSGFVLRNTTDSTSRFRRLWNDLKPGSLEAEPRWLLAHPACAWNKLYRRELFKDSEVRFTSGLHYEDLATIPRVLRLAARIAAVRKPLCYYRQRPGSLSRARDDSWKDMVEVLSILRKDFSGRFDAELSYLAAARLLTGSSVQAVKNGASDRDLRGMLDFMDREFPSWKGNAYLRTYLGSKNRLILELMKARAFWALRLLVDGKRIMGGGLGRST